MSDRIVLNVGNEWLVLDEPTYQAARQAARDAGYGAPPMGTANGSSEALLTAEQLSKVLQVPQSAIEQKTRERVIPCVRLGRWIRYRRLDVETALFDAGTLK